MPGQQEIGGATVGEVLPLPIGRDTGRGYLMPRKKIATFTPPPPVGVPRTAGRGKAVQAWLEPGEKEELDRMLAIVGLTKDEYLRWLITHAVADRRLPPGYSMPKEG